MAGLNIGELFVSLRADPSGLKKGVTEAQTHVERAATAMSSALKTLGIAFTAGAFFKKLISETLASQDAMAQLEARIKSTGGAAGKSLADLDALAQRLQKTTVYGDEATKSAEALLLTFKSIKGDTFDQATQATLDLATAMGVDLKTAALQLGKALEDPINGLTALRRSGVSFTEAQRDQIKAMVEAGDVAGAQRAILKELESQFGGAAAAARNTLGGALKFLSNQWGDLFEVSRESSSGIIDAINGIGAALPKLRDAIDFVVRGWASLGIHAALAVEQLELVARALDPRRLWSEDAQSAFEEQKRTVQQFTAAAEEAMVELNNGTGVASGGLKTLSDHLDDSSDAADKFTGKIDTLHDKLADLGKLPTFEELMAGFNRVDISGAKDAEKDFMKQAKAQAEAAGRQAPAFAPTPNFGPTGSNDKEPSLISKALGPLKDFGSAIAGILSALNPWKLLLDAVGRALGDFLVNMTPIVELLASALMPILKALFPIFKLLAIAATYVGQVFFTVAGAIQTAVGYLIKGLGTFIDSIPFVGDFGLKKAGQALIDLGKGFFEASGELGKARDEIKALEWKDVADGVTDLGDAAKKTAEVLNNVPETWNANLARFRATSGTSASPFAPGTPLGDTPFGLGGARPLGGTVTFTGDIVLPNVKSGQDFYREVAQEAVRVTARGGAPVISDLSRFRL